MMKALSLALFAVALAAGPAAARGNMDQQSIRQIQEQLKAQGYDPGAVDGIWGQASRQALMKFQRDQNLRATGQPDQQSLSALGVESTTQQAQTPSEQRRQQQEQPRQQELQGQQGQQGGQQGEQRQEYRGQQQNDMLNR